MIASKTKPKRCSEISDAVLNVLSSGGSKTEWASFYSAC
jgi:hypothetical protein